MIRASMRRTSLAARDLQYCESLEHYRQVTQEVSLFFIRAMWLHGNGVLKLKHVRKAYEVSAKEKK
jgi:hypothetical protein